jgi:hypothetical protein
MVFVKDSVGVYPFIFQKGLTKKSIKASLKAWGITTKKAVDCKCFNSVKVDLNEDCMEEL